MEAAQRHIRSHILDIAEQIGAREAKLRRACSKKSKDKIGADLEFLKRIEGKLVLLRDALREQMRARMDDSAPYAAQARAWLAAFLAQA